MHNDIHTVGNGRLQRCLMPLYTVQLSNERIKRINIGKLCKQASIFGLLTTSHGLRQVSWSLWRTQDTLSCARLQGIGRVAGPCILLPLMSLQAGCYETQ